MKDFNFITTYHHQLVGVRETPETGRYTVALEDLQPEDLIDTIPVLVIPQDQIDTLRQTELYNYVFEWDEQERYKETGDLVQCDRRYCQGVALGLISLCNHSFEPNTEYRFNYEDRSLDWVAIKPIGAGEEITIHYRVPLWFEMADS